MKAKKTYVLFDDNGKEVLPGTRIYNGTKEFIGVFIKCETDMDGHTRLWLTDPKDRREPATAYRPKDASDWQLGHTTIQIPIDAVHDIIVNNMGWEDVDADSFITVAEKVWGMGSSDSVPF